MLFAWPAATRISARSPSHCSSNQKGERGIAEKVVAGRGPVRMLVTNYPLGSGE